MPASIPLAIFFALLLSSTVAIPQQRRGIWIPDSIAGSPKADASTADVKAVPSPSTSEIKGLEAPPSPKPDVNTPLLDELLTKPPPEVKPNLVQRIKDAWSAGSAKASQLVRELLDKLRTSRIKAWEKRHEAIMRREKEFQAAQDKKLAEFQSDEAAKRMQFLEGFSPSTGFREVLDHLEAQEAEEMKFHQVQNEERSAFLAKMEGKKAKVDASLARSQRWIDGMARLLGGKGGSPA